MQLPRIELDSKLAEFSKMEGALASGAFDLEALDREPFRSSWLSHVQFFDEWIDAGFAGSMAYLSRRRAERRDPRAYWSEAKAAWVTLWPYARLTQGSQNLETGGRYARYLRGPDYHDDLKDRIGRILAKAEVSDARVCVDTAPVLERSLAWLAGLGWIGKNTLLIHPREGSYHFISVVFLRNSVGRDPEPMADRCGACQRCLDGCPTRAFVSPGRLDSRKCISYQTLEDRSGSADRDTHGWIAGCDVCQEVCPFNLKPERVPQERDRIEDPATALSSWSELDAESESQYQSRIAHSALSRVKWEMHRRTLSSARPSSRTRSDE